MTRLSYGEIFSRNAPYYLMCGMTYDQYWHGDPWMVIQFEQAHKLRIEMRNQELWLQGLYNYNALATALSNAFAEKGSTPKRYLEQPIDIFPKTEEELELEEERELRKAVKSMTLWEKQFNSMYGDNKA